MLAILIRDLSSKEISSYLAQSPQETTYGSGLIKYSFPYPHIHLAIIGLQAASVQPLPIPIKSVDIKRPEYPPEKIVKMIPKVCVKNANCIIRLGPIV